MNSAMSRAREAFETTFAGTPDGIAFAPGRVNLIGDHVDYQGGLVLPMPLALGTAVAWRRTGTAGFAAQTADYAGAPYRFDSNSPGPVEDGWHSLVHGMAALLRDAGAAVDGLELAIAGNLPRGAGLSSSASLCIATGRAMLDASSNIAIPPDQLALIAQQVEHRFAGVACGIMDQMVIAAGEPGAAMLLDCRSLDWQQVNLPLEWCVLVIQSGVERELVEGAYNARRCECESAARKLDVDSLRDVDAGAADFSGLEPVESKRAQHVVHEIERTRQAAAAIQSGDIERLGELLRDAHASMRDLFEASHPEVDAQVDRLNALIGAQGGARMTGGGFGGAIVAVCDASRAETILEQLDSNSEAANGHRTNIIRAFN